MITFRNVEFSDARMLHAWRNDPETRKSSRSEDEVSFADHIAWLTDSLSNKNRRLLIAMSDDVPIGTIRFDCDKNNVEMSWTVAPECRRKGLGKKMVQAGKAQEFRTETAYIKSTNIASIKIAEACDFKRTGADGDMLVYRF